jgi:hypothetical protein
MVYRCFSHRIKKSVSEVLRDKNLWLIKIDDVIESQELYDIALKENELNKNDMNPLSHYIVLKKLNAYKEKGFQNNPRFRKGPLGIPYFPKYAENDIFISNCNLHINDKINEVLQHAFTIHTSYKLLKNFIINQMQNFDDSSIWEFIYESEDTLFVPKVENFKIINWKNVEYFGAYDTKFPFNYYILILHKLPYQENTNQLSECPVNSDTEAKIIEKYIKENGNIIINTFDEEITNMLFAMALALNNITIDTEFDEFYKTLKSVIGCESFYGYVKHPNDDNLLIYYENFEYDGMIITAKCVFAATICERCIAVFVFEKGDHNAGEMKLLKHIITGLKQQFNDKYLSQMYSIEKLGNGVSEGRFRP